MIITISDVSGPRGGDQPLAAGTGYRAIYPPPQGVSADELNDLAEYLQLVVDPHRVRGVNLDDTKLEIVIEAESGGKITTTRALYDALKAALESYVAGQPAPQPGGGQEVAGSNLAPLLVLAAVAAGFALLMHR